MIYPSVISKPEPVNVGLETGIALCNKLYEVLKPAGFYPALTGGLLYKHGLRKDIDIVIYRNRQKHLCFEMQDIEEHLMKAGLYGFKYHGFLTKAVYNGYTVDLFNPETDINFEDGDH